MTDVSKSIPHTNKHSLFASQVPDSSPTVGTLSIRSSHRLVVAKASRFALFARLRGLFFICRC